MPHITFIPSLNRKDCLLEAEKIGQISGSASGSSSVYPLARSTWNNRSNYKKTCVCLVFCVDFWYCWLFGNESPLRGTFCCKLQNKTSYFRWQKFCGHIVSLFFLFGHSLLFVFPHKFNCTTQIIFFIKNLPNHP